MYLIHVHPHLFISGQKQIHCRICFVPFRKVNDGQSPENTMHCASLTCVAVSFFQTSTTDTSIKYIMFFDVVCLIVEAILSDFYLFQNDLLPDFIISISQSSADRWRQDHQTSLSSLKPMCVNGMEISSDFSYPQPFHHPWINDAVATLTANEDSLAIKTVR